MMIHLPTPIEELKHPLFTENLLKVYVKRDDLTHPEIMGNKWRKLKYNLMEAKKKGFKGVLTMGGAYSNHLAATAAATLEFNLKSIGIVRGDELHPQSNPTLSFAFRRGMQLKFVDRKVYRDWRKNPVSLVQQYPEFCFLPEGGTNQLAMKGCGELIEEIPIDFDLIVCPIGTGGTFCGILSHLKPLAKALGVSTLKGDFVEADIQRLLDEFGIENPNYSITKEYHFGGYAKTTPELIDFINGFKENFNIQLDPIYTGKSFFAVWDMIKNHKFEKHLRIILLHTGGLQGIDGFNRKNQNIIQ